MNPIQPNSIEQAQALFGALTNAPTHLTSSADEVLKTLQAGAKDVLVELPWGEERNGEVHARHQIILTHVSAGRVHFINALKSDLAPGTVIQGTAKGPMRRVEPNGEESMETERFVALFQQGGKAMIQDRG
ncbi:MAG TPA: hypothetical protein V6D05_01055 [Stenomitos sp.]